MVFLKAVCFDLFACWVILHAFLYQMGFLFGRVGDAPRVGLKGTVWGVKIFFFFEIQPDFDV